MRPDQVRRAATLAAVPWKNGGGTTREVAVRPRAASLDDFVWRASIAEIAQDGAFSDFPGIDRTIVLLAGAGMDLARRSDAFAAVPSCPAAAHPAHPAHPSIATFDRHVLREPHVPLSFDGAIRWHARLVDGPTLDFNLMVRRGAARGTLTVWRGAGTFTPPPDSVLLFVAHGTATLYERGAMPARALVLERFDSVQPGTSRRPAPAMTPDASLDAMPDAMPDSISGSLPDVTLDAGAVMLVVGITAWIDTDTNADARAAMASRAAQAGTPAVGASAAVTVS